jgi:hypothetical protein
VPAALFDGTPAAGLILPELECVRSTPAFFVIRAVFAVGAQAVGGKVMIEPARGRHLVITVFRLVPYHRSDWTPDKRCRLLTGWYADEHGAPTFIFKQVGEVLGWDYCEWVDEEPQAIKMCVRVRQEP